MSCPYTREPALCAEYGAPVEPTRLLVSLVSSLQSLLPEADGVLFHGPTFEKRDGFPRAKPPGADYVFVNLEPSTDRRLQLLLRDQRVSSKLSRLDGGPARMLTYVQNGGLRLETFFLFLVRCLEDEPCWRFVCASGGGSFFSFVTCRRRSLGRSFMSRLGSVYGVSTRKWTTQATSGRVNRHLAVQSDGSPGFSSGIPESIA